MNANRTLLLGAAVAGMMMASGCSGASKNGAETTTSMGECHGMNSCKGTGDCGGSGHSCHGKNSCKGKGWKKMSESDCKEKGGKFKG